MNFVTKAWSWALALVQPDMDAIIKLFLASQSKLEQLINREVFSLEKESALLRFLEESRLNRNAKIDRAYRIIHRLDTLTA